MRTYECMEKKIISKEFRVSKFKSAGVIKVQSKELAPFIGKELEVTIKEPKKKVKGAKK